MLFSCFLDIFYFHVQKYFTFLSKKLIIAYFTFLSKKSINTYSTFLSKKLIITYSTFLSTIYNYHTDQLITGLNISKDGLMPGARRASKGPSKNII